ncbi:hypothetical protein R6P33_07375 [Actinotignum timonense]|uniref:Bacterial toxin 50 domain-containing protein n=1 Tax=Actinotignum timonense TaxID=1870995 RepID=A0AAW9HA65_9ACTO|nr:MULTISPECIES: hypothetical protein [Actinotignum]MDK6629547.1 hypothetical protein [Actinotignum timonense]MDY5137611.1 hypothetical protein [Actinotignum timonense]MDY5140010.1 hypothetical protein [Actinotignum timonense]MDY5146832.1 hypothetical protein [Actinotignum timonense]
MHYSRSGAHIVPATHTKRKSK